VKDDRSRTDSTVLEQMEGVLMTPWVLEAGDSLKRLLQGAAAGALVTMIVGFSWGGWTLGNSVETVARAQTGSAIAATLAPICVD
jgi:hypothetical protein